MSETKPIQFGVRFLLGLTVAVAVLCSLGILLARYVRSVAPNDPTGPVTDRAEWPHALQEFISHALPEEGDIEPVKVYCWNKFIDQEHVWQHKAAPELVETMVEHFDLEPIDGNSQEVRGLQQRVPPSRCKPSEFVEAEYFVRKPWVNGHDGSRCVVMHDPDREVITVWYLFVF